jgi:uncharacterized protein GlcG (DUF336 family)
MKTAAVFHSLRTFLDACREAKKRMVICYADRHGHTIMIWRETDAWLGSLEIAQSKAWTAIAFSGPTEEEALTTEKIAEMTQPGQPLYGLQNTNQGKIVIFGGGIPIYLKGKLHGAIGVSGSTVDVDVKMAKIAVEAYIEAYEKAPFDKE